MPHIFTSRIEYFLRCAEARSLREASRLVGISQSALSASIKGLEEDLGIRIFQRSRSGIRLTRQGLELAERLRAGRARLLHEVFSTLSSAESLAIKIGSVSHFALDELIPLLAREPEIFPKYQMSLTFSLHALEAVRSGQIHCAFVFWSSPPESRELVAIPVRADPSAIVGLRSKFAHIEKAASMQELESEPWILQPKPQFDWTQLIEPDKGGFVVRDMHAGRRLVLDGRGIGDFQLDIFTEQEKKLLAFARHVPSRYRDGYIYAVYREDLDRRYLKPLKTLIRRLRSKS